MSDDRKTMDKEKLENYLSEKFSKEEGKPCRVIIKNLHYVGNTEDGDKKISLDFIIRSSG